jgi:hypothetical protein
VTLVVDQVSGPYTSIGAAVIASTTTDIVSIEDTVDAVYDEAVTVDKSITIVDNSAANVTLTKTDGDRTTPLFDVAGGVDVTFQNLTFADTDGLAIDVNASSVTVEDCSFSGCDGDSGLVDLGSTVHLFNGSTAVITGCTFDNTVADLDRNGSILFVRDPGTTIDVSGCTFKNRRNPDGDGPYSLGSAAVSMLWEPVGTFSDCRWNCDGAACLFLMYGADATANRCIFQPLIEDATDRCDRLIDLWCGGGVGETVYLDVTNCVLDGYDLQTDTQDHACIFTNGESYIDVNYSTLIRAVDGIFGIGDPYDLRVTNSLIGRNSHNGIDWIQQGSYTWDLWIENNHFWANVGGTHVKTGAGINMNSYVVNTDGDGPPDGDIPWPGMNPADVQYELQGTVNMADLGTSTLLGTTVDDLDETGVRPRDAANDKGAQEGQRPTSTGVQIWEIYR